MSKAMPPSTALRNTMELNTVRVFVRDLESAKHFYSSKLGLPVQADGSAFGYCVFKAGRTELVV